MPPIKKFTKEEIVKNALDIVKRDGLDSLNARNLAKKLGCSVQPIFHNFKNMEELQIEVKKEIYAKYQEYLTNALKEKRAYKEMGLSYIRFAKEYPEFFKIMFMNESDIEIDNFMKNDVMTPSILTSGQEFTKLSLESQKKFHQKVWIFTHGLACLVATKTIKFKNSEISELLENSVKEMLIGFKEREEK